jgi:hypothetical protein
VDPQARWLLLPEMIRAWCYRQAMSYPLTAAQAHLGELVAETRQSHRPVSRLLRSSASTTSPTSKIARLWRRTWRTRPPGAAESASMDWMLRSTGSMQKRCREPDCRLPADGAS